jgi:hypothetical protein
MVLRQRLRLTCDRSVKGLDHSPYARTSLIFCAPGGTPVATALMNDTETVIMLRLSSFSPAPVCECHWISARWPAFSESGMTKLKRIAQSHHNA